MRDLTKVCNESATVFAPEGFPRSRLASPRECIETEQVVRRCAVQVLTRVELPDSVLG